LSYQGRVRCGKAGTRNNRGFQFPSNVKGGKGKGQRKKNSNHAKKKATKPALLEKNRTVPKRIQMRGGGWPQGLTQRGSRRKEKNPNLNLRVTVEKRGKFK